MVSVTLLLVQYRETLSGGDLPSLKIKLGTRTEHLKPPRVAACFLLYSRSVCLQREEEVL